MVCSIIGVMGCAIGLMTLLAGMTNDIDVNGVTLGNIIQENANMSVGSMYTAMAVSIILCIGETLITWRASAFFKRALEIGNPFRQEVALGLRKLGIISIILPIVFMSIANATYITMNHYFDKIEDMHIDDYGSSVGVGIAMIILSLLCSYGAELTETKEDDIK